jgi:hypothetical protein
MVSKLFLEKGYIRQWMPTPWLRLIRNSAGVVTEIKSLMPQIDDLDPKQYYVSLAIPKEITVEIASGLGRSTVGSEVQFNNLGLEVTLQLSPQDQQIQSDPFDVEFDDDGTPLN